MLLVTMLSLLECTCPILSLRLLHSASLQCPFNTWDPKVSACELGAAWQCALSLLSRAAADPQMWIGTQCTKYVWNENCKPDGLSTLLYMLLFFWFLWARHIFAESKDWPLDRVIINAAVSSCEKGWQWETWLSLNAVLWEALSVTGDMWQFSVCGRGCGFVVVHLRVLFLSYICFVPNPRKKRRHQEKKKQKEKRHNSKASFPSEDRCLAFLRDENLASDAVTFGAAAEACSSAMRWTEALAMAAAAPSVVTSKAALVVAWMQWKKWNQWRNIWIFFVNT